MVWFCAEYGVIEMRDRVPPTVPAVPARLSRFSCREAAFGVPAVPGRGLSALLDPVVERERVPISAVPAWGALVKRVCVPEAFSVAPAEKFALVTWLICDVPDAIPAGPFFDLFPLLGRDCVAEVFPALPDFTALVPLVALWVVETVSAALLTVLLPVCVRRSL